MSQQGSVDSPLVVTRAQQGYTLYNYRDRGDLPPQLIEQHLESVPEHLKRYQVSFGLAPNTTNNHTSGNERQRPYSNAHLPVHLRNLAVIDSKFSGAHRSSEIYFNILLPLLKAFGLAHVYVSTASPRTISDHSRSFSSSSTVIFLAGDTSIHEFINCLAPTSDNVRLTVAAVPTGTGNALSTSVGHQTVPDAISKIFTGQVSPLTNFQVQFPQGSTFVADDKPAESLQALVVASWGFHASIVADSDSPEFRRLGSIRFLKAAEQNLQQEQRYCGVITTPDGKKLPGPHSYVLFTVVSSLEKTFMISPDSHAPTGDLHLVQFDLENGDGIMDLMTKAYDKGAHVKDSRVVYKNLSTPSSAVTSVQLDKNERWCVDGRIVSVAPGTVQVHKPTQTYNGWNLFIVI